MTKISQLALGLLFSCTGISAYGQTPNWAQNIAPIIYTNCGGCHIPGALSSANFVGFANTKSYGIQIKNRTQDRSMPPWPANPEYKRYAHEKILSGNEIKMIADWVDNGMPAGDTSKAPMAPTLQKGSTMVNPSLSLKMPNYTATTTDDEYRCFVMPTGLTTDQYLTQIEVIPGNLKAVHHVLVFHDTSSIPSNLDKADSNPGYLNFGGTGSNTSVLIGVWVPGQESFVMPTGAGIKIEKKGYIIFQVHYPKGLVAQLDSSKVFLKLSPGPLREVFISAPISHGATLTNGPLYIPANTTKTFYSNYNVPTNVSVFAVAPHMHLIGKSIKAYGVLGTDTTPYVEIPNWDFHWQRTYVFPKIQKIPVGTKIKGEGFYDNTADNDKNPSSPPKNVSVGERTTDEMMLIYFWYMIYQAGDENVIIDTSSQKKLEVTASIKSAFNGIAKVYPNPAGEQITLNLGTDQSPIEFIGVYSTDGREITAFKDLNTLQSFDVSALSQGMYFLRMRTAKQNYSCRFIKE